jgi:hypothetical protein
METRRSPVQSVVVNLGVLAVALGIVFVLAELAKSGLAAWFSVSAAIVVALGCGVVLAWKARARVAAVVLAGLFAALASELLANSVYGGVVIRGRLPHFALMGSGLLGVLFGFLLCALLGGGALLARRRTDAPRAAAPAAPPPADLVSQLSA